MCVSGIPVGQHKKGRKHHFTPQFPSSTHPSLTHRVASLSEKNERKNKNEFLTTPMRYSCMCLGTQEERFPKKRRLDGCQEATNKNTNSCVKGHIINVTISGSSVHSERKLSTCLPKKSACKDYEYTYIRPINSLTFFCYTSPLL